MLEIIWRGALGMNTCQVAWVLLSNLIAMWLISYSGPVVYTICSWAHATMPVVATALSVAILLWVGLHPAQLLFYAACGGVIAQNPPAKNGKLGR